ncbi:MAG: hypothetical protein ACRC06_02390 [Waterburya sp.]
MFNTAEIKFVVAQFWNAEMKVKEINLFCNPDSQVEQNSTVFAD